MYLKARLNEITAELLLDFKIRHKTNYHLNDNADLYTISLVCYVSRAGMGVKVLLCQDMGEGVGGVGSRHGGGVRKMVQLAIFTVWMISCWTPIQNEKKNEMAWISCWFSVDEIDWRSSRVIESLQRCRYILYIIS